MTKRQEIELLAETAAKLGPDSYCGPWLTKILPEVERDIRSDFFPMHSPEQVRKDADQLVLEARKNAEDIRIHARAEATRIREQANEAARAILAEAVQKLQILGAKF